MGRVGEIVAIALAGGRGERARPITVKAPGYLRSKAAMSFLGRRLIRWIVEILRQQEIRHYYVVAHGKENRYQIKVLLEYGEPLGIEVRYSRVKFDVMNTGSADATLRNAEYWGITGPALIFPTDSVVDFDLAEMYRFHREKGALVTVACMVRGPVQVAGKYGVILADPTGRIRDFVEKPTLQEIREYFPARTEEEFERFPLLTNAGFYLADMGELLKVASHPEVEEMRRQRLDFGMDFLPWLVGKGLPIYAFPVERLGDLGTVSDYLETMVDALRGSFRSISRLMGPPTDPDRRVWVDVTSLYATDDSTGTTLAEKIQEGRVKIGPNVRIGRYVLIEDGVTLEDCNVDDGVEIREGAVVVRSSVRDGAILGPYARIENSYVGSMAEIRSEKERPTWVAGHSALGDEVQLQAGVRLYAVSVWPRVRIPLGAAIPPGTEIKGAEDVMAYL